MADLAASVSSPRLRYFGRNSQTVPKVLQAMRLKRNRQVACCACSATRMQGVPRRMQDGGLDKHQAGVKRTRHGCWNSPSRSSMRDHQSFSRTASLSHGNVLLGKGRHIVRLTGPRATFAPNQMAGLRLKGMYVYPDTFDRHCAALISLHCCASVDGILPCKLVVQASTLSRVRSDVENCGA